MKLVVNIVRRLTPRLPVRNLIFVETMEEAHALMNKRYPVEKIPFDLNHG